MNLWLGWLIRLLVTLRVSPVATALSVAQPSDLCRALVHDTYIELTFKQILTNAGAGRPNARDVCRLLVVSVAVPV